MTVNHRVEQLQAELNAFTGRFVEGIDPISEDGISGQATESRLKLVKQFLGYSNPSRVSDQRLLNAVAHVTALAGKAGDGDQALPVQKSHLHQESGAAEAAANRSIKGSAPPRHMKLRARLRLLVLASATTLAISLPMAAQGASAPVRDGSVSTKPQLERAGIALPPGPCISLCGR